MEDIGSNKKATASNSTDGEMDGFGYGNQYVRMDHLCGIGHGNARANGNKGDGIVDG